MLRARGVIFAVRRHRVKNYVQIQSGPSTPWHMVVMPEDFSEEERLAIPPYQWHHLEFLRVSGLFGLLSFIS